MDLKKKIEELKKQIEKEGLELRHIRRSNKKKRITLGIKDKPEKAEPKDDELQRLLKQYLEKGATALDMVSTDLCDLLDPYLEKHKVDNIWWNVFFEELVSMAPPELLKHAFDAATSVEEDESEEEDADCSPPNKRRKSG